MPVNQHTKTDNPPTWMSTPADVEDDTLPDCPCCGGRATWHTTREAYGIKWGLTIRCDRCHLRTPVELYGSTGSIGGRCTQDGRGAAMDKLRQIWERRTLPEHGRRTPPSEGRRSGGQ